MANPAGAVVGLPGRSACPSGESVEEVSIDPLCFDRLTRFLVSGVSRRHALRLLAGGAGAALAGVLGLSGAGANHLGECRGTGARCNGDDQCCTHRCRKHVCRCAGAGGPCTKPGHCCGNRYCQPGATCSDTCAGKSCEGNGDCCAAAPSCTGNLCGGCRPRGMSCSSTGTPCCYSECNSGACLSRVGQKCAQDSDCEACYFDRAKCDGACVGGVCTV